MGSESREDMGFTAEKSVQHWPKGKIVKILVILYQGNTPLNPTISKSGNRGSRPLAFCLANHENLVNLRAFLHAILILLSRWMEREYPKEGNLC
jgi:hypothetical protein